MQLMSHIAPASASLLDVVEIAAGRKGSRTLFHYLENGDVIGPQTELGAAELFQRSQEIAAALQERLRACDQPARALIICASSLEFVKALFGCILAGVVAVPIYPPLFRDLRSFLTANATIFEDARPDCVLIDREIACNFGQDSLEKQTVAQAVPVFALDSLDATRAWSRPCIESHHPALIQYTSGSTMRPKGVLLSHGNIVANLIAINAAINAPSGSIGVNWLPPSHDMGLIGNVLFAVYADIGKLVLMSPLRFMERPVRWLHAISYFRAWGTSAPNFAYDLCTRTIRKSALEGVDLSSLQLAFCGAEPIDMRTLAAFIYRFAPLGFRREAFRPCYGLAEATLYVSSARPRTLSSIKVSNLSLASGKIRPPDENGPVRELVSCGPPQPDIEVAIVNPLTNERVPAGRVGELWIRGPSVAREYWGEAGKGAQTPFHAILRDDPSHRFLRTGDLGTLHDGQLYITGRIKDVLIFRGRNYDAHDIEAAVAGIDTALRPGRVTVFSDLSSGCERVIVLAETRRLDTESEYRSLADKMRRAISRKIGIQADTIEFVAPRSLPVSSSGKLRRALCRELWSRQKLNPIYRSCLDPGGLSHDLDAVPARGDQAPMDRAMLKTLIEAEVRTGARLAEKDPIPEDATLREIGLDSLGVVQLWTALSAALGHDLAMSLFIDDPTIRQLIEKILTSHAPGQERSPTKGRSIANRAVGTQAAEMPALSVMFFSADEQRFPGDRYGLIRAAARIADERGFEAVWIPERHFHRFGGLFPNPAIIAAMLATETSRVRLRAGSIVLPLHDPIRVAEEWAVVDNLSNGRVDLAFATGWDADSFVLAPETFANRREATFDRAREVQALWLGHPIERLNGVGITTKLCTFPRPAQPDLSVWITIARDAELFRLAGSKGYNVLTALLFQSVGELSTNIAAYRDARASAGYNPADGRVSVMLHFYLAATREEAESKVDAPLKRYLEASVDLWRRESVELSELNVEERSKLVALAFERYTRQSSLIGDEAHCLDMLRRLRRAGTDEIACLIDFGLEDADVLRSLQDLADSVLVSGRRPMSFPDSLIEPKGSVTADCAGAGTPFSELPTDFNPEIRHVLSAHSFHDVFEPAKRFRLSADLKRAGMLPFYLEFSDWTGTHASVGGHRVLILSSLDYLGLACDPRIMAATARASLVSGSGRSGSRVHSGSAPEHREMEVKLAKFVGRQDALICTTGYQAMAAVVTALMNPNTTLVVDESVHASILDGAAIAKCRLMRFRHNDVDDLRRVLDRASSVLVMVEGLYSNDGDVAPLPAIRAECNRFNARLAVDDAHGLGVLGVTGRGVEEHYASVGAADILAGTFSKSLASIGGWIAGDPDVIEWIRYHGRTVLFTAAIAPPALAAASAALDILIAQPELAAGVARNSAFLRQCLRTGGVPIYGEVGPVIRVPVGDDLSCVQIAMALFRQGIYVHTVLYPSVPKAGAMLRLCVSAIHQQDDLAWAAEVVGACYHDVIRGGARHGS